MPIISIQKTDTFFIQQAAELLVQGFAEHWPDAWPTIDDALEEVHEMLAEDRIFRTAIDNHGLLLGWVGGIEEGYDGNVWELHPMVVRKDQRGRGVGRALVADLEEQVRKRGGLTLTLGTDDEDQMTTLGGANLYENLWEQIRDIRNLKGHPYEFYQKCGFIITGVLPDANGPGKPDIFMSKRLV